MLILFFVILLTYYTGFDFVNEFQPLKLAVLREKSGDYSTKDTGINRPQ